MTEDQLQEAVATLLAGLGWCWTHVPNGGARDARVGSKLKRAGVRRGVPDVYVWERWEWVYGPDEMPAGWWGSPECDDRTGRDVAIELKVGKGRVSRWQSKMLDDLAARGVLCAVARAPGEVIQILRCVRPRNGRLVR